MATAALTESRAVAFERAGRRRFKGPIRPEHEFETGTARSNLLEESGTYSVKGTAMTQADHYRDQSNRAKRLAKAVKDPEASQKLIEMAEEFRLYAERLEQTH
jgi:hypothetical protein